MSDELRGRVMAGTRVAGAFLVFGVFLIFLMAAISQQSVMTRLSEANVSMGYSSAYATVLDIEDRRKQVPAILDAEKALNAELDSRQTALREREEEYHSAWGEFLPLLRRAAGARDCGMTSGDEPLDRYDIRIAAWRDVEQCVKENVLPETLATQFQGLAAAQNSFPVAYRRALAADLDVKAVSAKLEAKRTHLASAQNLTDEERSILKSFDEVKVLRRSWLLGGDAVVGFPPALVQLLLSAASGAFGALIVTLVLIVYPKNSLTLITSSGYGPRMLLGALIAICVYVILLAGTAVLGSSNGFDAAGANYMTFCAISILAGMFSDRAADWLSDRANVFFARTPPEQSA